MFLAQITGNEHRNAHCELSNYKGNKVQHLTAGRHRRKAGGCAKMAHHQQIYCAVSRLQHQRAQNGKHKKGQLFQDASLRKIALIAFQESFSFRT